MTEAAPAAADSTAPQADRAPSRTKVLGVPLRVARTVVTAAVVLDLASLAGFAFHTTTSVTRTVTPLAQTVPVAPQPSTVVPVTGGGQNTGGGSTVVPVSNTGGSTNTTTPTKTTHHGHAASKPSPPTKPTKPPKHSLPPVQSASIGKCPIKLATPKHQGGLQSLVPLAPAFGPFSAEAFAAASAYQPELQLLGPILAQYPKFAPKVEPAMAPVLKLFATGSNQLFGLISPLYTPYRKQVLQAETKLAAVFAPYSQKLAGQPLAGCVVDLEAALTGDTKTAKPTKSATTK